MAGIVQSAGILADYARTKGRMSTTLVMFSQNLEQKKVFDFIKELF
jgi:hypothetical protein